MATDGKIPVLALVFVLGGVVMGILRLRRLRVEGRQLSRRPRPATDQDRRRSLWLYVFAAPIAWGTSSALVHDPFRFGDRSAIADQPLPVLVGLGLFVTAMFGGMWQYSIYRHRTPTLVVALLAALVPLVYLGTGLVTTIGWWDVVDDAVWAVCLGLLVLGGPGGQEPARSR